MNSKPTGRRFVFEDRRYTPAERRIEWMRRVQRAMEMLIEALETEPGPTYTTEVEVSKDDPRYESAPLIEEWIMCDIKYTQPLSPLKPHLVAKSTNLKLHPDNGR